MSLPLNPACNPSFFDFKGHVTADQSPPTNFASKNAFISCLTADTLIANTIITDDGLLVITGAINIGVGLGIIPPKPGDVSGSDIVHKSLLFIAPIIGTDGASVITISAPSVVVGPTPATSTDDAVVCWDGTTGRLVKNSTTLCAALISGPTPAISTDDAVVCWDGTSGRLVKNSTVICAEIVSGPASSTDDAVVLWDGTTGRLIKDSTLIGNAPSVGGLTLAGAFEVPNLTSVLTLTGPTVLLPLATATFPGAPLRNFIARFGDLVYFHYDVTSAFGFASPTSAIGIAILPLALLPTGVGIQMGVTLNAIPPGPTAFALIPGLKAGFAGLGSAISTGNLFIGYTAGQALLVAGQTFQVEGTFWQA